MIKFTRTKNTQTDWAIQTVTADGITIVCHFDDTGELIANGLTYNGVEFEDERECAGLYVRFGTVQIYNLVTLEAVIAEAEKQIGNIVTEAKDQDAMFDEEAAEADYAWTACPRATGRV